MYAGVYSAQWVHITRLGQVARPHLACEDLSEIRQMARASRPLMQFYVYFDKPHHLLQLHLHNINII